MKSLQAVCRERGFSACRVFDVDGEFLADQSRTAEGSSDGGAASAADTPASPDLPVVPAGIDPDKLTAIFVSSDESVTITAAALADENCFRLCQVVGAPSSVIMIADDMDALDREKLFALVRDPQIVEHMIDAESAAATIEIALERSLFRLTQTSDAVAGLEAA